MGRALVPIVAARVVGTAITIAASECSPSGSSESWSRTPASWPTGASCSSGSESWSAGAPDGRRRHWPGGITSGTTMPFAMGRDTRRSRRPDRRDRSAHGIHPTLERPGRHAGSVVGITSIVVGLAASVTFGASFGRLIREPFRYGVNYDALVGDRARTGYRTAWWTSWMATPRWPRSSSIPARPLGCPTRPHRSSATTRYEVGGLHT